MHGHTALIRDIKQCGSSSLITASQDATLKIWNITTKILLRTLKGHTGAVRSFEIQEQRNTAISASSDGTARRWNLETGKYFEP